MNSKSDTLAKYLNELNAKLVVVEISTATTGRFNVTLVGNKMAAQYFEAAKVGVLDELRLEINAVTSELEALRNAPRLVPSVKPQDPEQTDS